MRLSHCTFVLSGVCRREQLKKEGKLLTGKAKAEAERLASMRAQMLKQAEEKGETEWWLKWRREGQYR